MIKNIASCPICNSHQISFYKRIEEYSLDKCESCKIIFLRNASNKQNDFFDDLDKHQGMEYWGIPNYFSRYQSVFNHYFKKRINFLHSLSNHQVDQFTLLDIGAGFGFWAKFAQDSGLKVTCIEPNIQGAKYASEELKLNPVFQTTIEDFKSNDQFDYITLCDVLEHSPDPKHMLRQIKNYMNKDTLLYIQVPDALGIRFPYKASLGLPQHLWQFNSQSLKYLLESEGFIIAKKQKGIMGIIGMLEKAKIKSVPLLLSFLAEKLCVGNRLVMICRINHG